MKLAGPEHMIEQVVAAVAKGALGEGCRAILAANNLLLVKGLAVRLESRFAWALLGCLQPFCKC